MAENLPDTNVGNIEYIRKEDAVEAVRETFKRIPTTAIRAMDTIKALPSADVVQVVHGRWINTATRYKSDNIICDHCGYDSIAAYRYCPSCGAKMDGGDEHG